MKFEILQGDCLEVMRGMADNSVNLIVTDPPYFRIKSEPWDRQWDTAEGFLAWVDLLCLEFHRILKPHGSLYLFASPQMSARVECRIGERFNVLNRVTWRKPAFSTKAEMFEKRDCRRFLTPSEFIIFAEHYGADNIAKGESGYFKKRDELRGFLFEPLRAYLASERDRAGVTTRTVAEAFQRKTGSRTVTGMAGHWFGRSQWEIPTEENYQWLRSTFSNLNHGGEYLRREYEYLRREYEDLRRPFSVSADVPYTDVWTFKTVSHYPGKHPCEKPQDLLRHIISASSRVGDVVLDACAGSFATGEAALALDRQFIGIEKSGHWCEYGRHRLTKDLPLFPEQVEAASA